MTISEPVNQARSAAAESVDFRNVFQGDKTVVKLNDFFNTRLVADLPTPLNWLNRQEIRAIQTSKLYYATITANAQVTMTMISP